MAKKHQNYRNADSGCPKLVLAQPFLIFRIFNIIDDYFIKHSCMVTCKVYREDDSEYPESIALRLFIYFFYILFVS